MDRVTCSKCGEEAFAAEAFCPACGTIISREESEEAPVREVAFDTPVADELTGPLLTLLADNLGAGERVLVSLQNAEGNLGFAATNRRVLILRASDLGGAYGGASCRELPYLSLAEVKHQTVGALGRLQFMVRTIAGKPEVGTRGRMGKLVPENLAGLPSEKLVAAAAALRQLVAKAHAMQEQRAG